MQNILFILNTVIVFPIVLSLLSEFVFYRHILYLPILLQTITIAYLRNVLQLVLAYLRIIHLLLDLIRPKLPHRYLV